MRAVFHDMYRLDLVHCIRECKYGCLCVCVVCSLALTELAVELSLVVI